MKLEVYSGKDTVVILDQEATGVAEYLSFTSQFLPVEVVNELSSVGKTWATRMLKFDSPSGAQRALKLIQDKGKVVHEALSED